MMVAEGAGDLFSVLVANAFALCPNDNRFSALKLRNSSACKLRKLNMESSAEEKILLALKN